MSGLIILARLYISTGLAKIGVPESRIHLFDFIKNGTRFLAL
jgi:hypothetical protein